MNVLSLFDGMSCGRVALERAGIRVDEYYASEVDKQALKVSGHNYPNIIQLGDVTKWREWEIDWGGIDLMLAGFPCQAWSFAGKGLGLGDTRGQLAKTLLDILNHVKSSNPSVKFLFENVVMKREDEEMLTEWFGVNPVLINSALVSAQNRKRLYWCNWDTNQPEDLGVVLEDIVTDPLVCGRVVGRRLCPLTGKRKDNNKSIKAVQRFEARVDGKSGTITTVAKDNVLGEGDTKVRDFTQGELEALQTLPEGYTKIVSRSAAQKMIGNGWTVDVIVHVLGGML